MLSLSNVRDWLSSLLPGTTIYAGFIDANQNQCIGVSQRDGSWNQAIGAPSTYQQINIKLLVHWGTDIRSCEKKAAAVFDALLANRKSTINNLPLIDVKVQPPNSIGRDERGIFESIVLSTIIYETE